MLSHLPVSVLQILWTLTFAAHLVLLVVLLGRDRVARFPWFTASIVLVALRLLTSRLLFGRMPQMTMTILFIVMADVGAVIGIMVILEIARRAFGTVKRTAWVAWALSLMVIGGVVLAYWGAWPSWKTLTADSRISNLQLLQLLAQKASLLVDVENIAVGLVIVLFGRKFKAGWRSHAQQIAIGLSTASCAQLGIQLIWETIARTAAPKSMAEYTRLLDLRDHLFNTNNAVYIAVLIWWIVWLWKDEPGTASPAAAVSVPVEIASSVPDANVNEGSEAPGNGSSDQK